MKHYYTYLFLACSIFFLSCQEDFEQVERKSVAPPQVESNNPAWAFEQLALRKAIANGDIVLADAADSIVPIITPLPETKTRAAGLNMRNWMSHVDGNKRLSELSIPGTHDSGADGDNLGKTQSQSIQRQLELGVRMLDIRCRHVNDAFMIHHGPFYQNKTFGSVLTEIIGFLINNPSETVLMLLKEEHSAAEITRTFEQTFRRLYLNQPQSANRFWLQNQMPTLDQVRGKIVLIRRFNAKTLPLGIETGWQDNTTFTSDRGVMLRVQDNYKVFSAYWLDWKWRKCVALFDEIDDRFKDVLYINYLSGTGDLLLPYHCATGYLGYWGMNTQFKKYMDDRKYSTTRVGCVMQDYIEDDSHSKNIVMRNIPGYKITEVSCEELVGEGPNNGRGIHAFDQNNSTWWHTQWYNITPVLRYAPYITIKYSTSRRIKGVRFTHRPNTSDGRPSKFKVQYRASNGTFVTIPVPNWAPEGDKKYGVRNLNTSGNGVHQYSFDKAYASDEFRVTFTEIRGNRPHTFISEIAYFE